MPLVRIIALALCVIAIASPSVSNAAIGAPGGSSGEPAYQTVWIRQFGTDGWNRGFGVSTDGLGNVYTAGETVGPLGGPSASTYDAFTKKFDTAGNASWSTQFGTTANDFGTGVSADASGNVFLTGYTQGLLSAPNVGYQAYLARYAASGALGWVQPLGTPQTYSYGVSADGSGNAYIAGATLGSVNGANAGGYDAFVAKYDSTSAMQWSSQFGTSSHDQAYGVSADGLGSVYVAGATSGGLVGQGFGKTDAFLRKYNASGAVQWTQQLGTSGDDLARTVSADALGNVFIAGSTSGQFPGQVSTGSDDAFVSKYSANGTLAWTRQLGTSDKDYLAATAADGHGNVFVAGYTLGSLGGIANAGNYDTFLSKFDGGGDLLWTRQLGSVGSDVATGVAVDAQGNVYLSGSTTGSLGSGNLGSYDAWIARLSEPVLGDMDHDFRLTNFDIQALIVALADPAAYKQALGLTQADFLALGDVDGDDYVTISDAFALMNRLAGGPIAVSSGIVVTVPEPSSLLLLGLGCVVVMVWRHRSNVLATPYCLAMRCKL